MTYTVHETGSYIHDDDPGEPSTGAPRMSVTDSEADLLAFLASGKTVLEIGTGLGVSTRALASTARRVVTLDIDPWVQETVWPELPDNVLCLDDRMKVKGLYDVVFIDGDHTVLALADDVRFARERCTQGVILAHDAVHLGRYLADWPVIATPHGIACLFIGW